MRIKLSLIFLLATKAVFAQVDFGAAQSIGVHWDNDVYFKTDRYFTNGLSVNYHDPKLFKIFYKNRQTQKGLTLEHIIYTPAKFNQDIPDFDRPFTSSFTLAYYTKDLRAAEQIIYSHQLQIGLQGRNSGGRTVQNFVHSLLPNSEEIDDWQFQMTTDLILNYSFELEKGLINQNNFMLSTLIGAEVGSPQLAANAGLHLRLGKLFDRFKYEGFSADDWTLFFYTKPRVHLSAYNTYLQGGIFTHDQAFTLSSINHAYYDIESGVYFAFSKCTIDVSFTYQSPLAEGLMDHTWGSIGLSYMIN